LLLLLLLVLLLGSAAKSSVAAGLRPRMEDTRRSAEGLVDGSGLGAAARSLLKSD
jgi:hypothetical protein